MQLPGYSNPEKAKELIGKTAQLEFKFVDDGTEYMNKLGTYAESKKDQYFGLEVGLDSWTGKDSQDHRDLYLKAKDKAVLEKFIKEHDPERNGARGGKKE